MTNRPSLALAVALLLGCTPTLNFPSTPDASNVDATRADASTVDAAVTDHPAPQDLGPITEDTVPVDAPVAVDVPPAVDTPDVPTPVDDTPDVPDVPPTIDTPDVPDVPDVPATIDRPDVPDVPPVIDIPDVPPAVDAGTCPDGMVLIPGGTFTMGDGDTSTVGAQPPDTVTLSSFCIDLIEVTVSAFSHCTAAGCGTPGTTAGCNWNVSGRDDHPINCIDWSQSAAYCQWRGAQLPTEAQWEYAARGSDNRTFPWGNDTAAGQLCWSGVTRRTNSCPVRAFPSGNSPFGLFDMGGNIGEWTADWYAPYTAATLVTDPTGPATGLYRIERGGSWDHRATPEVRAAQRAWNAPYYRDNIIGMRCAHAPL